jgi:hypothetical protein
MNPFSKNYKSSPEMQAAIEKDSKAAASSRARTKGREAGMKSEDPHVRRWATGTMPWLGSDLIKTDKIKRGNSCV